MAVGPGDTLIRFPPIPFGRKSMVGIPVFWQLSKSPGWPLGSHEQRLGSLTSRPHFCGFLPILLVLTDACEASLSHLPWIWLHIPLSYRPLLGRVKWVMVGRGPGRTQDSCTFLEHEVSPVSDETCPPWRMCVLPLGFGHFASQHFHLSRMSLLAKCGRQCLTSFLESKVDKLKHMERVLSIPDEGKSAEDNQYNCLTSGRTTAGKK